MNNIRNTPENNVASWIGPVEKPSNSSTSSTINIRPMPHESASDKVNEAA